MDIGRQGSKANRWSRTAAQQSLGILYFQPAAEPQVRTLGGAHRQPGKRILSQAPGSKSNLLVVLIGCFGCQLQLLIHLLQKFLSFLGVALHVPLIGLLRGKYLLVSLVRKPLRRGEVRVVMRIDVLHGRLSQDDSPAEQRESRG